LTNLRVNYDLETDGNTWAIYGAVTNVFDKNPSDALGFTNIWGNIGRSYTAGVRFNF
jgi:outer membrane receptor protein involved in Fe transport